MNKYNFDAMCRMYFQHTHVTKHLYNGYISISNSNSEFKSFFDSDYQNVLRLEFDDVTDQDNEPGTVLFNREHAQKIIEFMDINKDIDMLYVHCLAGQSRSGAVGTFINDIYGSETYYEFMKRNPTIKSNYYILALLRRIYNNIEE